MIDRYARKELKKIWKSSNKGWPTGMLECFAEKIMYDFHWTDTMVHYNHNSGKTLDENDEINSISDENKKKWA